MNNLSLLIVAFFAGAAISLLFLGQISDYLGRKPTIIITILLALAADLLLLFLNSFQLLFFIRLLQGLCVGLANSAIASYIVDTAPKDSTKIAAIFLSGSNLLGLAIGSLFSAVIVTVNQNALTFVYISMILLLVICLLLVLISSETVTYKKGVLNTIRLNIIIPNEIKNIIVPIAAIIIGINAVTGFYHGFSASMAAEQFATKNIIVSAIFFSGFMAPQILGGSIISKIDIVKAQKYGMILFTLTLAFNVICLKYKILSLFILGTVILGLIMGVTFAACLEQVLKRIDDNDQTGVLSTIYLFAYGGTAVPALFLNFVAKNFNLMEISIFYLVLTIIFAVISILFNTKSLNNPHAN